MAWQSSPVFTEGACAAVSILWARQDWARCSAEASALFCVGLGRKLPPGEFYQCKITTFGLSDDGSWGHGIREHAARSAHPSLISVTAEDKYLQMDCQFCCDKLSQPLLRWFEMCWASPKCMVKKCMRGEAEGERGKPPVPEGLAVKDKA